MERLTAGNYRLFLESYASIYVNETGDLQEKENIQEFLQVVNELVEEGYDLSEYTYDELYEHYIEEGLAGRVASAAKGALVQAAQKYGPRALETVKRGAKEVGKIPVQGVKNIAKGVIKPLQTKTGSVLATAAGLEALLAGEKSLTRKALGKAGEGITAVGKAVYGDNKTQTAKPKPTPKPQSNQERNPYGLNQDFDIFDAIKGHLLDEGYAETEDAAIAIMANMGEEWRNSILEQSAIASRTAKVVDDQRQGYHGDFDAINKLQNATSKSIGRLKRGQGPVVTPGLPGV